MTSPIAAPTYQFCIPPNPTIGTLRAHAELSLAKLRGGRNIAGIQREVAAYAAPTDTTSGMPVIVNGQLSIPGVGSVPPTLYRYSTLIARAKELVQQAAQVEALFLSAAIQRDEATYSLQKARQELTLTKAQVRLQSLRLNEANHGVKLAELQKQRAAIQYATYQDWISRGLNEYEQAMLAGYQTAATAKILANLATAQMQAAQAATTAAAGGATGSGAAAAPAFLAATLAYAAAESNMVAVLAEADIQQAALQASQARRVDEWTLQSSIAMQDTQIGEQQITLAQDHSEIVQQEKTIAETQASQASDTVEFLANRFFNAELFDWMSGVLSDVYRSLLQQATAVARVAQSQLAFERQEVSPSIIRMDYWTAPSSNPQALLSASADDRRGLTGSARLLGDIYQLDQYAFDTNKRKLAISKTISFAQMAPAEFQRFRETGVIVFSTPMELFDRDFPGHYLRLIRRVRASVIALVPTTEGIHATLSSTGVSRVVVGPELFQTITIRRDPETVALTAPIGSTGVFELDNMQEMYMPFEGNGVDGTWEFRMPKASNHFDFRTLSDVLISIDYMALNSFDYAQSVMQQLSNKVLADRAFSFANQFPDAWYDLHNPDLLPADQQMIVKFPIGSEDFPANFESIRIEAITLYISRTDTSVGEIDVEHLKLLNPANNAIIASSGESARTIDGTITTRRGNGSVWVPLLSGAAGTPFGKWELSFRGASQQALRAALEAELIEDILFVVSYEGRTPSWPT